MSRLASPHYECHITVPVGDATAAANNAVVEMLVEECRWKTSEIKRDPVLGDDSHFYFTSHLVDRDKMEVKMKAAIMLLRAAGVRVLRAKIEHVIYDERFTDA